MTIRFRLGLALALALLPILVLGVIQAYVDFNRDTEIRRTGLIQAASRSAVVARGRIQGAVALLQTLTPQAVGAECTPRLAALLKELPGYRNIVRLDVNGRVECAAASVPPSADRVHRPWFVALRRGAEVALTRSLRTPQSALIAAVRAQTPSGRFDGALIAILGLDTVRLDLSDPTLPKGTSVSIVNAGGDVLAETDPRTLAPLPSGWMARAESPRGLFFTARDRTGVARDYAGAGLLNRDAFVVLSAPAPPLLAWGRLHPVSSLLLPLLAWLAAWWAVWVVTDRVVIRWLAYLDRIAAIYARGRYSVRPVKAESAPQEIRALAHTLNTMADGILARDLSLRESIAHKDALMREIHHRVKNNLQVITSLLNMQQRALKDPAARVAMADTRQRITALALIYRALYQSPDLRRVDVRQFLEELVGQLTTGEGGRPSPIRTELHADDLEIDPDKLAPVALFAVEAITIARKHAFGPEGGLVQVRFEVGPEEVCLRIFDNGVSQPDEAAAAGVGQTLMSAFARQLQGRAEMAERDGGLVALLIFPTPPPLRELDNPRGSDQSAAGNWAAA